MRLNANETILAAPNSIRDSMRKEKPWRQCLQKSRDIWEMSK
jgi:hypothetical protein